MPRKKVIVEDNQIVAEIPMEKHQRSIREHKQKAFDTYVAMKINKGHTKEQSEAMARKIIYGEDL
jgi:hypothetical protein